MRDPSAVTGIVVHQMATPIPITKAQIARAGGDETLARAVRAQRTAAHCAALRDGLVVMCRPLRTYLLHGNRFNAYTLGLEIEGKYSGIRDDPSTAPDEARLSTWRGPPQVVTPVVVEAARDALAWMIHEGRKEGMFVDGVDVFAHRQSSKSRRSDPGEELWERVVLDYAVPVLGVRVRSDVVVGSGRPVPIEWDPVAGVGTY